MAPSMSPSTMLMGHQIRREHAYLLKRMETLEAANKRQGASVVVNPAKFNEELLELRKRCDSQALALRNLERTLEDRKVEHSKLASLLDDKVLRRLNEAENGLSVMEVGLGKMAGKVDAGLRKDCSHTVDKLVVQMQEHVNNAKSYNEKFALLEQELATVKASKGYHHSPQASVGPRPDDLTPSKNAPDPQPSKGLPRTPDNVLRPGVAEPNKHTPASRHSPSHTESENGHSQNAETVAMHQIGIGQHHALPRIQVDRTPSTRLHGHIEVAGDDGLLDIFTKHVDGQEMADLKRKMNSDLQDQPAKKPKKSKRPADTAKQTDAERLQRPTRSYVKRHPSAVVQRTEDPETILRKNRGQPIEDAWTSRMLARSKRATAKSPHQDLVSKHNRMQIDEGEAAPLAALRVSHSPQVPHEFVNEAEYGRIEGKATGSKRAEPPRTPQRKSRTIILQ